MKSALAGALLALAATSAGAARAQDAFSSPAIDPSLFKDSALLSYSGSVGDWSYLCKEIVPIKKRICNLASRLRTEQDEPYGSVLIATDKDEKAAMLMRLPPPVVVARPLLMRVQTPAPKGAKKPSAYEKRVTIEQCSVSQCTAFVPLDNEIVFALANAIDVSIVFAQPEGDPRFTSFLKRQEQVASLKLRAGGFEAALQEANTR